MAVATYCYYEKVRRTMRTGIVSYLLKQKETTQLIIAICNVSKSRLHQIRYPGGFANLTRVVQKASLLLFLKKSKGKNGNQKLMARKGTRYN